MSDDYWNIELPKCITEIFTSVKKLGGTLSGEHGIGYVQKQYMPLVCSQIELELMSSIKNVFDQKGILNPSKILN
jgi:glycolate oxidase